MMKSLINNQEVKIQRVQMANWCLDRILLKSLKLFHLMRLCVTMISLASVKCTKLGHKTTILSKTPV